MAIEKRYQVFVSSTYEDLQEERQEVMQALLELDCMPSGMELFPAASEDQWSLIKKVIDDCDYYIVIVGGRYGSVDGSGTSYTEREYRYAIERGKPVIGFLHKNPGSLIADRSESDSSKRERLAQFRAFAEQKVCRYWETPADLGSQVSRSLVKLIKSHPAIGWVRADVVPDEGASREILRLRAKVEEVESQLKAARTTAPPGAERLAQGDDQFKLQFSFHAGDRGNSLDPSYTVALQAPWDDIFAYVAPLMIDEVKDSNLEVGLNEFLAYEFSGQLSSMPKMKSKRFSNFRISDDDFNTIKVQLRALGLIAKSSRARSVRDTSTYWTLTPYGDDIMTKLRALSRGETS